MLVDLVNLYGVKKWSLIAQMLRFRIGKQCRERWYNYLRPGIKTGPWSDEEDRVLIQAHSELGNKWSVIAKQLPGRTENSIKNRWNANKKKWFPRRTNIRRRPRKSGGSLLQNYMQSLAQFSAADENKNMPDIVQQFKKEFKQLCCDDQGASSSSSNLSNSGIDMGMDWSGAMPSSSLVMSENLKKQIDLPHTVFKNSFIF